MKSAPWLLIAQIVLIVLWYTVFPALSAWVVFIPTFIVLVVWAVLLLMFGGIAWIVMKSTTTPRRH